MRNIQNIYNGRHLYFMVLVLATLLPVTLGFAADEPVDEEVKTPGVEGDLLMQAGLSQLPPELYHRWLNLNALQDTLLFSEHLEEGRTLIRQLGELIEAHEGRTPRPGKPGHEEYESLHSNLVSILDQLLMMVIFNLPEEELRSLISEYQSEREEIIDEAKSKRRELLDDGISLLRQHQSDPFFLRFPHRREVIAELYFRVTELTYQETYDQFIQETDDYVNKLNEFAENYPDSVFRLTPPKPNYKRVISMFQRIVEEFPTSEYADDALYNIGYLTTESDSPYDKTRANQIFETLIRIYPKSDYVLNALRRIADYYFKQPDMLEKSIEVYTRVVNEFSESEFYTEALYKLGWCYYRLSMIPEAVEHFALSLDATYGGAEKALDKSIALNVADESINYIGVCFSLDDKSWDNGGIDNLILWLENHPQRKENYGRELIVQLAVIYHKQIMQFPKAVEVYQKYSDVFPLDIRGPEVQKNIVDIFQGGDIYDPPQALQEKILYFENFNFDSEWWAVNEDTEVRESIIPILENYLKMILDEILVEAAQKNDREGFELFEHYSRTYLRFWRNGPNAYEINYNLASVLEKNLSQPVGALREFWQVATAYADTNRREIASQRVVAISKDLVTREQNGEIYVTSEGEIRPPGMIDTPDEESEPVEPDENQVEEELEEGAIEEPGEFTETESLEDFSEEEMVEAAGEEVEEAVEEPAPEVEPEPETGVKRTPLLHSEELLLASFDLYTGFFPESELTPTILYQAGNILFDHKQFPESRAYFKRLILEQPTNQLVEDSYRLIIEGYFESEDYAAVEEINQRIGESNVSDELKSVSSRRKAESVFLKASGLMESNNHLQAANEFKRVALETPDYQYADRSLFQAGLEYMQAGTFDQANEAFLMVADRYPSSEYSEKSLYNAGFNLQNELRDPAGSAMIFERMVSEHPGSELAQIALANASSNYNQVEDHTAAIRVNELYIAKFPNAEDANAYLFENANHYLALGQEDKANGIYRRFAQRYPDDPRTVQAYYERGKFFLDTGRSSDAAGEFKSTVDAHERLAGKGLRGNPKYASQALNMLLSWEHEEYDNLQPSGSAADIVRTLDRKKQWRNALFEKYQKLLNLGAKEGYKAFYSIGRLDEELAVATFSQQVRPSRDINQQIESTATIVDESIILNQIAVQSFREGMTGLIEIGDQLRVERDRLQEEYYQFADLVAELQKVEGSEGVNDSLDKLNNLRRVLSEVDSAVTEADRWSSSCRQKIPEVQSRNSEYLKRLFDENLNIRSDDRDEEIRLLFREEVLNGIIMPFGAELAGFYLQALDVAREFNTRSYWQPIIEERFNTVVDSIISQYREQCEITQFRIDRFIRQYEEMLPRGEDAESPDGYYPDEMGGLILDQIDYWHDFAIDPLMYYSAILDTLGSRSIPVGFGDRASDMVLQFALDQNEKYKQMIERAQVLRERYLQEYESNGEIQYDEAVIAFEDMAAYLKDYALEILDNGLVLRQEYEIPGLAGIVILRTLISTEPETYIQEYDIESEKFIELSSTDWLIWNRVETDFETVDFDDMDWRYATRAGFPFGTDLGKIDSSGATAIWYYLEHPGVDPAAELQGSGLFEGLGEEDIEAEGDSSGVEQIDDGEETPVEEESPELMDEVQEQLTEVSTEDSLWAAWMAVDSTGTREYCFRYSFYIESKPASGHIYLTADDDFNLFINGYYIAEDSRGEIDWMDVKDFDVSSYLVNGDNLIAIQVSDMDATRHGLAVSLEYEIVRDLQEQLDNMVERELERQRIRYEERMAAQLAAEEMEGFEEGIWQDPEMIEDEFWGEEGAFGEYEEADYTGDDEFLEEESALAEPEEDAMTDEMREHELRTIEKNKLR